MMDDSDRNSNIRPQIAGYPPAMIKEMPKDDVVREGGLVGAGSITSWSS